MPKKEHCLFPLKIMQNEKDFNLFSGVSVVFSPKKCVHSDFRPSVLWLRSEDSIVIFTMTDVCHEY